MKILGIYKIQSIIKPERCYIGSAICIGNRWNDHLSKLRKRKHSSRKLQNHYNKYGESDLVFSVLLGCDKNYLIANEQFFIDSYKPWFNVRIIAESNLGCKSSEETKQKLKGRIPWNKGKKATPEARLNQSKSHMGNASGHKGKPHSIEAKLKMSKNRKGKMHSEETKRKMSLVHKGKPIPEESKKKMREEKRGMYQGKKMSDEYKQKIKDSWVIRKAKKLDELIMQISNN